WEAIAPSYPQPFNSARFDAFDQWVTARRDLRRGSSQSASYLPAGLRMYGGTFDQYGSWQQDAAYGPVWYPIVAAGWQPYYNGYWAPIQPYGWTWIGVDFWTWPTHHYGRWGYHNNRWFWIPGRYWGPGWVSWGSAPGYVSWCPLGFDNRPLFALSVGVGHAWDGWTIVPRSHFGRGNYAGRYAVSGRSLPDNTPFVSHASAPLP